MAELNSYVWTESGFVTLDSFKEMNPNDWEIKINKAENKTNIFKRIWSWLILKH